MLEILRKLFRKLTPLEAATRELIEAQHGLLQAQTGVDYSMAIVEYETNRVNRLRAYISMESGK